MTATRTRHKRPVKPAARIAASDSVRPQPSGSALPQAALDELLQLSCDPSEFISRLLDLIQRQPHVAATAYLTRDRDGRLIASPAFCRGAIFNSDATRERLVRWSESVCERRQPQSFRADELRNVSTCCVPVLLDDEPAETLVAAFLVDGDEFPAGVAMLRLLAATRVQWHTRRTSRQWKSELESATAIVELAQLLAEADSPRAACYVLVDELREFLGCDQASVGLSEPGGCRTVAVSGLAEFDRRSDSIRQLEAAFHETLVRGSLTAWPPHSASQRHAVLAHRQLAEHRRAESVVSVPLATTAGATIGVLTVIGSRAAIHDDSRIHFLRTAAGPLASALAATERASAGVWLRVRTSLNRFVRQRGFQAGLIAAAALAAVLAVPWPYHVNCSCVVEPVSRRISVAPQDGLLETTLVEPGDVVERDQVLAQLDGREIRWTLAGLEAERHQAAKEHDKSLAAGDVTKAHLAKLEMERTEVQIDLLRFRAANLEVKCPLDGLVLSSTFERLSSAPVKVGQPLFEIAPLDPIKIEVEVPAEDFAYVPIGAAVEVSIDGFHDGERAGQIAKLRPRSEIRDGENVFVAEVVLDNAAQNLRPGMKGQASVRGPRHSLAWNLFHKPWQRLMRWLGA